MDTPASFQYRARFTDLDGIPQTVRFKNEPQARRFLLRLLAEQPGVRVVVERRQAIIGPWERIGGGR